MAFNRNSNSADDADLVAEALEEMELSEEKEKGKEVVPHSIFSKTRATVTKFGSNLVKGVTMEMWDQVEVAVESIPSSDHAELTLVGKNLIVIRKEKDDISLTKFSGPHNIVKFSEQVRFKYGMFDDHMPWGYNSLFSKLGISEAAKSISLEALDIDSNAVIPEVSDDPHTQALAEEPQPQVVQNLGSSLYPDLSSMM